jgi:ammonium transporter, Amt family
VTPSSGDTAWVLTSAALVLLMTPGLALFYGGMVRAKSVLNMMMMSFGALGLISVLWVLYGYSLAFGDDVVGGLIGNLDFVGLKGLMSAAPLGGVEGEAAGIPPLAFVGFQAVFAIITVALISGAIADRAKFGSWMVFAGVWATVVYFPVAHWVFAFDGYTAEVGGWIANDLKAIDFAGGTAVHINAGAAGLALALVLGKRIGFGKEALRPHNLTLVMIGAVAWINTLVATAAASLAWCATEKVRDGHATSLGAASGVVAGLVAITPACSAVNPVGAILVGAIAGVLCALAVSLKFKWGYDDSLDVVGVHLVGGVVGTLLIGILATSKAPAGVDGLLYGGGVDQLWRQAVAAGAVLAFSFVLAYVIGTVIDRTIGFRLDPESEVSGVDLRTHAESAYELGSFTGSGFHTGAGVGTTKEKVDA